MNGTGLAHHASPMQWAMVQTSQAWKWCRVKDVALVNRTALPQTTDPDLSIRYIDISSVTGLGSITDTQDLLFGDAPTRARRLVREGDSIVSTVRTYLKAIAYIDGVHADCVVSTGFATVTPGPAVHPEFLFWWLRSSPVIDEIEARSVGVSYPAINGSEVGTLGISLPPIDTQIRIAEYLTAEVVRLDRLLEQQTRLVGSLEQSVGAGLMGERRQALITSAVLGLLGPGGEQDA